MIILSTKLLTLPVLLSILLCIAKGQSVEELCEKHENEFNELFVEKKGGAVTEVLWEESLEKKADKEEEKERLEEQKKTENAKEKDANAKNVSWLSTLLGNYLCQKLRKKDGEQKKKQNVPKKLSSKTPKESVPLITKMDTDDKSDKRYEAEFAVKSEGEIFEKIRGKFGIRDEQLLMSLSEFVPLNGRGGSGGVFYKTVVITALCC
ncbi:hypothetical protein niasHS_009850 [Heterodera schachtii]|uniref:Uncharacterized protein n=1 Tax=Heterodera schachtii TaxID=97005 RepID=A0ABD2JAP6_HETSC